MTRQESEQLWDRMQKLERQRPGHLLAAMFGVCQAPATASIWSNRGEVEQADHFFQILTSQLDELERHTTTDKEA